MDLMEKLASLAQRYEELNTLMAQPEILDDIALLQRYGREHAELEEVVQIYHELSDNQRQIEEAQEIYESSDDPEMRDMVYEEIERLKQRKEQLLEQVKVSLLPKDIMDDKNAIVTIQGGAGGDEAALFAGELFRMYSRYADNKRWKIEILDSNETAQGGIKDITFVVKGRGAYSRLKYEGGTHRVQRVPVTEANGRIHRCVPLHGARRPERQHHRLGSAHHAPAYRPGRHLPGREIAAEKQNEGSFRPQVSPVGLRRGSQAGRTEQIKAFAGANRRPQREDSHL